MQAEEWHGYKARKGQKYIEVNVKEAEAVKRVFTLRALSLSGHYRI